MNIPNLQSILTQDSLCTSDPIYVVYSKQEIAVDPYNDYDKIIYVRGGDEIEHEEFKELEHAYNKATDYRTIIADWKGDQIDHPMPEDPGDEDSYFDPEEWEKQHIKYVDRFEQAFFIRENAENFLKSQRHNLGELAYIYVESAHRNPEWQQIRELLISAAKKNENVFGQLKFGLEYNDIVDGMWVIYSELPHSDYANSLKQIWKTDSGWREQTHCVQWEGKYEDCENTWECSNIKIWEPKCYAPVEYDEKVSPVDFLNKVLPLTIKGTLDK